MNSLKVNIFVLICTSIMFCFPTFANSKTSNKKIYPVSVIISGIGGKALKNAQSRLDIQSHLITLQQNNEVKWHFYGNVSKQIKQAVEPFGYFKCKVKTSVVKKGKYWTIYARVTPGKRLHFTQVSIQVTGPGQKDKVFRRYLNKVPIQAGKPFNSNKYQKTKDALQNIANLRGYFNAKFVTSKLVVNLSSYTSQVDIEFATGPRFRFGVTHFSASAIRQSLLKRYFTYDYGQYYSGKKLEQSRINLSSSDYFQQVVMLPKISQAKNDTVPIHTTLYAQDQVVYNFGAGYGTDTGIRGMAAMDIRWINSHGHKLKAMLRGSQRNSQLAASYIIPGLKPAKNFFTINGGLVYMDQVTGTGRSAQLGTSYQTLVRGWRLTTSLNYLMEKYKLFNYPRQGDRISTNANLLYPRFVMQRTYAQKNLLNPEYGYNILFTVAAASKNVGSKTSFSQSRIDTRFLYTLPTHTRILPRLSFGATSIADLVNLPLSMQFYTGGADYIRGFEYNSIGPGKFLVTGSFEIQQKVYKKFYAAGFIDAGNVADNLFEHKLKVGSGPAIVYLSPVGAIELSFAKDISSKNGPWRIQFSMGALI